MKNALRGIAVLLSMFAISAFGQELAFMKIDQGWNLKGNSFGSTIKMTETFGNFGQNQKNIPGVTDKVSTVWKWDSNNQKWLFYTTRIDVQYLEQYATARGYGVLTEIFPGEGFWVNSTATVVVSQAAYDASYLISNWGMGGLQSGWNLLASPIESATPGNIAAAMNMAPPSPADQGYNGSVISLWAWDNQSSSWYFYSPGMASCGQNCLRDYIYQKGYLDFVSAGKTIKQGDGFWLNYNQSPPYYGGKG